jgi:hypothetical protein
MKKVTYLSTLAICMALAGCSGSSSSNAATPHPGAPDAEKTISSVIAPANRSTKDELQVFEVNGMRILDSQVGDLNGDGRPDALIVLDPPSTSEEAGQGPSRTVLLAIRNAEGHLQVAVRSDKLVSCKRCGGVAGDPFGYARIDQDGFTLVTEGGSREHWWNRYAFKYASAKGDWMIEEVERGVADTIGGGAKKIILTRKDLGEVRFEDFRPSTLPRVTWP